MKEMQASVSKLHPKISVIVPVYNTQAYLRRCLDSISAQTFDDFEVVCVDDGSTDDSASIIEEYATRDSRFRPIRNRNNLGLGPTRNIGLRESRGEYIASVDSDDVAAVNLLEVAWKATRSGYFDVVQFGYSEFSSDGKIIWTFRPDDFATEDLFGSIDIFTMPQMWNKLTRRSLYLDNGIFHPERLIYEDLSTTPRIFSVARSFRSISDTLYYYRTHRPKSIMTSVQGKQIFDYLEVYGILLDYFKDHGEAYREGIYSQLDRDMIFISRYFKRSGLLDEEIQEYLKQLLLMKIGLLEGLDGMGDMGIEDLLAAIRTVRTRRQFAGLLSKPDASRSADRRATP